jgi:hypothetical protein
MDSLVIFYGEEMERKIAKLSLFVLALMFLFSSFVITLSWAEPTPKEILRYADEARGNLEGVIWKVYIFSIENERQQERRLDVKARGFDYLATMTSPSNMKGQKMLMIERNMWFMKPGTKKPVPITSRQKLVGGAAIGDIAATDYTNEYNARPLDDEMVDGELCHVFDLKAIDKKTTYDQIKYWVAKERLVGVKAEYFTVSGKMFKSARMEYKNKVQMRGEPHPFISKMVITDAVIPKNITTLTFSEPRLVKVPDSTFDLNLLMR